MLVSSYGYRKGRGGGSATYTVTTPKSIKNQPKKSRNDLHKADEKNYLQTPKPTPFHQYLKVVVVTTTNLVSSADALALTPSLYPKLSDQPGL
jgi:hypothetical protein